MSTRLTRILSPGFAVGIAAVLAVAACNREAAPQVAAATPSAEIAWARAALERNPDIEVVASDPQAGVFTVKHRSSGEVEAVKLSDLAAAPLSQLKTMNVRAAPAAEPEPGPTPAPEQATVPAEQSQSASPGQPGSSYTIERAGGQVRVSGPGVSIVSSGSKAAATSDGGAARRTVDPFICEGRRTLQLDNRDIYVDGDAITARGGCEVFITNSNIVASGTGIVVQDATVHISNSHVEGANASFQAEDRAKLYVRGSTFQGVPRRAELAMVQDQGGNKWR
jgi:hypothetical protein